MFRFYVVEGDAAPAGVVARPPRGRRSTAAGIVASSRRVAVAAPNPGGGRAVRRRARLRPVAVAFAVVAAGMAGIGAAVPVPVMLAERTGRT